MSDFSLKYDDLPFWSAPFGLALLDRIRYRQGMNVLDIGSGGGFPMLEVAERLGATCRVCGIDPSADAVRMVLQKIRLKGIGNAQITEGTAENLPFEDGFFSLVISNNGLNNVDDPVKVLSECRRVCRPGSQLVMTVNLPQTFTEFYDAVGETLIECGLRNCIPLMEQHIASKRKPVDHTREMILSAGFGIRTIEVDGFKFRFADAGAFFGHFLIREYFTNPWKSFIPEESWESVISSVSGKLDLVAGRKGVIEMSVPFACFDFYRP